jgi:hypothetical protein
VNLTDEQKFVVLLTIVELGGAPTKAKVLDHVEFEKYYHLDSRDVEWLDTRLEQRWRNDLSYTRERLKEEGSIDGSIRDCWRITNGGKAHLLQLAELVGETDLFQKLTAIAEQKAVEVIPKLKEP